MIAAIIAIISARRARRSVALLSSRIVLCNSSTAADTNCSGGGMK